MESSFRYKDSSENENRAKDEVVCDRFMKEKIGKDRAGNWINIAEKR